MLGKLSRLVKVKAPALPLQYFNVRQVIFMLAKLRLRVCSACVLCWGSLFLASQAPMPSFAQASHQGAVVNYHLNSGVTRSITDRGVCIQMDPPIPGTGWACVYKDNSLYQEITDLLRVVATGRSIGCNITYAEVEGRHPSLKLAECSQRMFFPE